jgi:hypothetical protein
MNMKEIKLTENELNALVNTLKKALGEGAKYGKEISYAYESGYYIGTIKATISHLEELVEQK